jgi:PilZ domain-containing protein
MNVGTKEQKIMPALIAQERHIGHFDRERTWPLDPRMAMFVLEAGSLAPELLQQRADERIPCRIDATIASADPRAIEASDTFVYIRDYNDGHVGFICERELAVGSLMWMHLTRDDGERIHLPCRVGRSRHFMTGWHEGVLDLCEEPASIAIPA